MQSSLRKARQAWKLQPDEIIRDHLEAGKADIIDTTPDFEPPTVHSRDLRMASFIARRAFTTTARRLATGEEALRSETKKNPELAVRDIPIPLDVLGAPTRGLCGWTHLRSFG